MSELEPMYNCFGCTEKQRDNVVELHTRAENAEYNFGVEHKALVAEEGRSAKLLEALKGLYGHTKNDYTICGLNETAKRIIAECEVGK